MDIALAVIYSVWAIALVWNLRELRRAGRPSVHVEPIRAGDTVVFQTDRRIPRDKFEEIRKGVQEMLPENVHVLVAENMEVKVLRESDDRA